MTTNHTDRERKQARSPQDGATPARSDATPTKSTGFKYLVCEKSLQDVAKNTAPSGAHGEWDNLIPDAYRRVMGTVRGIIETQVRDAPLPAAPDEADSVVPADEAASLLAKHRERWAGLLERLR